MFIAHALTNWIWRVKEKCEIFNSHRSLAACTRGDWEEQAILIACGYARFGALFCSFALSQCARRLVLRSLDLEQQSGQAAAARFGDLRLGLPHAAPDTSLSG
jgi:hypothetical protein